MTDDNGHAPEPHNGKPRPTQGGSDELLELMRRFAEAAGASRAERNAIPTDLREAVLEAHRAEDEERWEDAIDAHRRVADLSDEYRSAAWERIGDLYRDRLGRPIQAIEAYRRALEVEPGRLSAAIELAQTCEQAERWEDAAQTYRRVAELSERHRPAALGKVGHMLARLGRLEEAEAILQTARRAYPDNPQVAVALAAFYEDIGRWDEALEAYRQAAELEEDNRPTILGRIGVVLAMAGRVAEAEAALIEAELAYPGHLEVAGARARLCEELGRWPEAIDAHRQIADRSPEYRSAAWERIGDLYRDQLGQPEQAMAAYRRSLEAEPERLSAVIELAHTFEQMKRWLDAIAYHRQVADLAPHYRAAAWEHIGDLYRDQLGQPEQALESYRQSLGAEPGRVTALFEMGRTYEALEQWEEAIETYRRIARVSEEYRPTALGNVSLALVRAGRVEEAEETLRSAEAEYPGHLELAIARANLYEHLGRWAEAAEVHRWIGAVSMESEPAALGKAATALLRAGRPSEAEDLLRRALARYPNHALLELAWAGFLDDQQRWEEAVEAYLHAAQLSEEMRGDSLLRAGSICLEHLRQGERALQLLEQARPDWSHDPANVLMQAARAYELLEQRSLALETYQTMEQDLAGRLDRQPSQTALRRLGWVMYKTGRLDQAARLLAGVRDAPEDVDSTRARVIEAALAFLAGDMAQARALLRAALKPWADLPGMLHELRWEAVHDIGVVAAWHRDGVPVEAFAALFDASSLAGGQRQSS